MMRFLSQKRFFEASLLLLFFVSSSLWVRADETVTGEESDYACASTLAEASVPLLDTYQEIINEYTKVDAPTSDQFEDALSYYRYVEDTIRKTYDSSAQVTGYNKTMSFSSNELSSCRRMRDSLIEYARVPLTLFLNGATTSKTTFVFVDGLKAMNEDLRDMSLLFQSTFPAQFTEMSNALPCYAHTCLSQ